MSLTEGLGARVQTQKRPGHSLNAFLVFDYRDPSNFKYAGMYDGGDKWVIGKRVNGGYADLKTLTEAINTGQWYDLELVITYMLRNWSCSLLDSRA